MKIYNITQEMIDRFWTKIIFPKDHINDCWIYNGCKDKDGYGIFWIGVNVRSNRFSFIIHNQNINIDNLGNGKQRI